MFEGLGITQQQQVIKPSSALINETEHGLAHTLVTITSPRRFV